jgi:hypothetical protein
MRLVLTSTTGLGNRVMTSGVPSYI